MEKLFRASGASILVPPGIPVKPVIRGEVPVGDLVAGGLRRDQLAWVSLRLEYAPASGRFEIAAFGIDRRSDGFEISGAFLRTVKVHSIARLALREALPSWANTVLTLREHRTEAEEAGIPAFRVADEGVLLLTATVYRIAEISGERPALAVSEALGLKTRTATNWIQRAREAGLMSSTTHAADARRAARRVEPYLVRGASSVDDVADELERFIEGDDHDGNH